VELIVAAVDSIVVIELSTLDRCHFSSLYFKLIDLLRSNAGSWYLFAALFTSCYQFLAKTTEPQW
jgi:hypothetical protein